MLTQKVYLNIRYPNRPIAHGASNGEAQIRDRMQVFRPKVARKQGFKEFRPMIFV